MPLKRIPATIRDVKYFRSHSAGYRFQNYLCMRCGSVRSEAVCCGDGRHVRHIGIVARAPRNTASRKQWKTFCNWFNKRRGLYIPPINLKDLKFL